MLLVAFLVPLVVLATRAVAGSTVNRDLGSRISLPISSRINHDRKFGHIQRDRKHRKDGHWQQRGSSTPNLILYDPGLVYEINIGVGDPPNPYNLILDTAGANTWVGANAPYIQTVSSVQTDDSVSVQYTSRAQIKGTEYNDTLTFVTGFVIFQQSIGVANPSSSSFNGIYPWDGVLGIGPNDLSIGTLDPDNSKVIPTVTDTLFREGVISRNLVALFFQPTSPTSATNGEMTFGDVDPSKYTGHITYFPITKAHPANKYWGVDASIRYGRDSVILNTAAGVIDTMTNLILLTTDAYNAYAKATGGVLDEATGLLRITAEQYANLQPLTFVIGHSKYKLIANAQILPRVFNVPLGGESDGIYLIVQNMSFSRQSGLSIVFGRPFLERFYTVLDSGHRRVGFATTHFTEAETN